MLQWRDCYWAPGVFVAPRLHRIHLRFRLVLLLTARPELRSLRRRTVTWGDELKLPPTDQTDGDENMNPVGSATGH